MPTHRAVEGVKTGLVKSVSPGPGLSGGWPVCFFVFGIQFIQAVEKEVMLALSLVGKVDADGLPSWDYNFADGKVKVGSDNVDIGPGYLYRDLGSRSWSLAGGRRLSRSGLSGGGRGRRLFSKRGSSGGGGGWGPFFLGGGFFWQKV